MIHDHFDGSANCRQCAGRCRLQGDARAVTELARALLCRLAMAGWTHVPIFEADALMRAGVDRPNQWLERARAEVTRKTTRR